MDESNESHWEPYVWRGALGGTIGMLVVVALGAAYVLLRFDHPIEMLVIMGVFGLLSGVLNGVVVGYVIYKVSRRLRTQPNAAVRIAIGTGCILVYQLLTDLTSSRPFHLTFMIACAISVGGLAGLMSRAKISPVRARLSQGRA